MFVERHDAMFFLIAYDALLPVDWSVSEESVTRVRASKLRGDGDQANSVQTVPRNRRLANNVKALETIFSCVDVQPLICNMNKLRATWRFRLWVGPTK